MILIRRKSKSRRPRAKYVAVLLALAPILPAAGCSRSAGPPPKPDHPDVARSPRQTLSDLLTLRQEHKYRELRSLVVPERDDEVVRFLTAVDDFLTANRRLCNWIRTRIGVGMSQTIDQSYVADDLSPYAGENLALFSRAVEFLDETIAGDQAVVSFTVDGRIPAGRARLRKIAGVWHYDPGPWTSDRLPAAFHDLARGLEQALAELQSGRIPLDDLRRDPEILAELLKARLRRGVNLLSQAQTETSGSPNP